MTMYHNSHHDQSPSNENALPDRRRCELLVERGELRTAALRGLQVRRIVAAEAVTASQSDGLAIVLVVVRDEAKGAKAFDVVLRRIRFDAFLPFGDDQHAAYFVPEEARHDDRLG